MPPITVKKKKLTVKTVRAKQDEAAAPEKSADGSDLPPGAEPIGKSPAAATADAGTSAVAAPPVASAPVAKPASYVLAGTLAIIAVIMFVTLIIIQVMEWDFFKDAFPRPQMPTAVSSSVRAPSTSVEPLAEPLDAEPLDDL